jgi:hypothetical protein
MSKKGNTGTTLLLLAAVGVGYVLWSRSNTIVVQLPSVPTSNNNGASGMATGSSTQIPQALTSNNHGTEGIAPGSRPIPTLSVQPTDPNIPPTSASGLDLKGNPIGTFYDAQGNLFTGFILQDPTTVYTDTGRQGGAYTFTDNEGNPLTHVNPGQFIYYPDNGNTGGGYAATNTASGLIYDPANAALTASLPEPTNGPSNDGNSIYIEGKKFPSYGDAATWYPVVANRILNLIPYQIAALAPPAPTPTPNNGSWDDLDYAAFVTDTYWTLVDNPTGADINTCIEANANVAATGFTGTGSPFQRVMNEVYGLWNQNHNAVFAGYYNLWKSWGYPGIA